MSQIQAQRFSSVMLLASTAALAMTACGGGGGSNPLASANVLRGLAVDGYLQDHRLPIERLRLPRHTGE